MEEGLRKNRECFVHGEIAEGIIGLACVHCGGRIIV